MRHGDRLLLLQAPLVALFVLAGFVGKPFQQKIPVPHISDEDYVLLKMTQALQDDIKTADLPEDEAIEVALSKVTFRIHDVNQEKGALVIPHDTLLKKIKDMRSNPKNKSLLEGTAITAELREVDGKPKQITWTVAQILDTQKAMRGKGKIIEQLVEAHEVANTTNPRYTYILLFLISIIVLWSGCNNAAKEIVKEEAVYGRERAVNLGIVPYLASKFIVLSFLTIVQTLLLMVMSYGVLYALHVFKPAFIEFNEMPANEYMLAYLPQFGVLSLLSMTGVALGLLLSACVATPDRANALLPYVLIPQIILGGGIMPIKHGVLEWLAWVMSPEYWTFRAIRLGETTLPNVMADNRMDYVDALWLPCMILVIEAAVLLIVTAWFLRKKDEN